MDKTNFKDDRIRKKLEKLHFTNEMTNLKQAWKEEKKLHKSILREIQKEQTKWIRLTRISNGLNSGHYGNIFPISLLKLYAPFFFENYPDGKIWFIPLNQAGWHSFIKDERIIAEKYKPDKHILGFSQSFGIGFDSTLSTIGFEIPMLVRFPHFQGTITGSMSGFVCFVLNEPISMYDGNWNLHGFLMDKTKGFYTDSNWNPFSNPKSIFNHLNLIQFSKYFDWYIERLNNLYNFVLSIPNLETKWLVSLSVARICLDTYLIQLIEEPYLRKMLFFTLLDKYANLIRDLGSQKREEAIWEDLLSLTYFEKNLKPLVKKIPRTLQVLQGMRFVLKNTIRHVLHSKYDTWIKLKAHEKEAIEYLRAYRNSHHGYLLRQDQRIKFLKHTGEIPNYLPDYSIDLWHTFIADPKKFISKMK